MRRLRNANTDRVDRTAVMAVRGTGSSISCTVDDDDGGGLFCLCNVLSPTWAGTAFTAAGRRKQWGVFRSGYILVDPHSSF